MTVGGNSSSLGAVPTADGPVLGSSAEVQGAGGKARATGAGSGASTIGTGLNERTASRDAVGDDDDHLGMHMFFASLIAIGMAVLCLYKRH